MPFPVYVEIKHPRQEIKGTVKAIDKEGLILGLAYETHIMDTQVFIDMTDEKRKVFDYYRGFTSIKLVAETGPYIPALYHSLCNGEQLTEVIFYWPTVTTKNGKEHVYLQQRIFPVKLTKVHVGFPNVKAGEFERYPHLCEVWFRYRFLETLFVKGYHITKVEWPHFYSEGLSEKDAWILEQILKGSALTDNMETPKSAAEIAAGIAVFSPAWTHKNEEAKQDTPDNVAEGDTIVLSCEVQGLSNGSSVQFEIEYKEPKGSPIQFESASGVVNDSTACGEWTVNFEKLKEKKISDFSLSFVASARSKASRRVEIPVRRTDVVEIERLYHDNEPVQEAPFEIECADATTVKGTLDTTGKALVAGLKSVPKRIRFEPDAREFKPVNLVENAEYKAAFSQPDADAIVSKATAGTEQPPEKKGIILDSIQWVTGTLQGSFNQKQTTSQIIVDAIIGMIPVVGDVTAVRDIIAVTIGLSLEEQKRKDKFQWLTLVLLLFALIPVVGGAIKGVGRLLLKGGKQASHLADFIAALNRIGIGDAAKFIKNLDLTKYTADLLGKWRELLQRLDAVISAARTKLGNFLPRAYIDRLEQIRKGLATLKIEGEKMIPESVKELQSKLQAIQDQMYKGEWTEVPKTLKSSTREVEARLVERVEGGKKWVVERMEFPPAKKADFVPKEDWPDLTEGKFVEKIPQPNGEEEVLYRTIEAFSGPIRPVKLPPGTKIRRVLDASKPTKSHADGLWWCYELPKDGKAWREDFAVLEPWSKNGVYVEYVVEEPGLVVWEGKVSSQIQNNAAEDAYGQYLPGGATQILIDFENPNNVKLRSNVLGLEKKQTNWGDSHYNVNVPDKEVVVQKLKAQEIAPKGNLLFSTGARTSRLNDKQATKDTK